MLPLLPLLSLLAGTQALENGLVSSLIPTTNVIAHDNALLVRRERRKWDGYARHYVLRAEGPLF